MPGFNYILLTGGVICSCIIVLLLIRFGTQNRPANLLLSIAVFALAWYAMMYVLVISGAIRQVPELYNKGIPLYYLIAPCCYLYLRFSLYPGQKLIGRDIYHFLPALLAIVDILPYAFAARQEKLHLLDQISADVSKTYQHSLSFIPQQCHYVLRLIQAGVYIFLQWQLLACFTSWRERSQELRKWFYHFTVLITLLNLLQALIMAGIVLFPGRAGGLLHHSMPVVGMCIVFFLMSVMLFFKPAILYGLSDRRGKADVVMNRIPVTRRNPVLQPKEPVSFPEETGDWNKVTELMEKKQLFRQEGLTLHQLSAAAGLPAHQLSEMLSIYQKQHFNTYINTWRIQYVISRIEQGDSKILTLESLAKDAGFTSRNTFYTAFKKKTGMTPARYTASLNASGGS